MKKVIYKKWDERYEVGTDSSVWSLNFNWSGERKQLKLTKTKAGYWKIIIRINGKKKGLLVHRMMAILFIPNPDNLPFINHKNGIRDDNTLSNLEWCTPQYNVIDGWKRGRTVSDNFREIHRKMYEGSNNPTAFITADMVKEVLRLRKEGMKIIEIEKLLGIKKSQVSNICRGNHYLIRQGVI